MSIDTRVVLLEDKIVNDAINIEDKAKGVIQWKVLKSYLLMIGVSKFIIMLLRKSILLSALRLGLLELSSQLVLAILDQRL